ncbi:putative permease [Thioalkalivibrio nitratireducens DSM 14787]|uniref:Probable membrane transporter protein n=1 Tax=Thioalkalivibrio nitratireducens (strain DSM 14787 / UNIQEM 213 / ALEN2) TaxID=1255043 RepID=L0DZW8_THIND|nr:putative permease [Thioalkalivibrio nitratireducens DSM 14787]
MGVPPVAANATGTAALLPGYIASAWSYRDLMRAPVGLSLAAVLVLGTVGGAAGAALLLATSDAAFRGIIPWLLLFATLLFALGPALQRWLPRGSGAGGARARAGVVAVCAYGGYFNGGMGIVMLALFRLLGVDDLRIANGLKNLLSAVLTLIAVSVYAVGGIIDWAAVWPMALGATAGGLAGAGVGRRLPPPVLRNLIVAVGAITTLLFFLHG